MTWKNYSINHFDQTVADTVIWFAEFGNQHQELLMRWPFVSHHDNRGLPVGSPGKSRSTTWKNYSIDHCDQTVTDMMIRFAEFGCLYQGKPNLWPFVDHYHHMENHGQ